MKRRYWCLALLILITVGCRTRGAPPDEAPGETPALEAEFDAPPGISIRPYEGAFKDYRPLTESVEGLLPADGNSR
jgi:hypothetical protein